MIWIWLLACTGTTEEQEATPPAPGELPELAEEDGADRRVPDGVEPPPLGDDVIPEGSPPSGAGRAEEPHAKSVELEGLLGAGDFDGADALVDGLRAAEPQDARVAAMKGLVIVARAEAAGFVEGQPFAEGADTWFLKAVDLDRELGSAWRSLADWYELNYQPGEALRCYQELVALDPDDALIRAHLGVLLERVLVADPDNQYALAELALVELNLGDDEAAEEHFQQALAVDAETYTCPYEGLGLVYLKRGEKDRAQEAFEKAISINPEIEYRKFNELARLHLEAGRLDEAEQLLRQSIANHPYDDEARELLAQVEARR